MIDVIGVRVVGNLRLEIRFSDGTIGIRDFASLAERRGPLAEPLRDPAYFALVFVDDGALTWPNGYDFDPTVLHDKMSAAGELHAAHDAAE